MSVFSCRDRYEPDVISSPYSYLVVEGVLTVGGPASIRLTRTSKLDTTGFRAELNAQVTVEGKDNTTRPMVHSGSGNYSSPNLNLVLNTEYRLRIRTSAGKEYLSEYVMARQTPAIDSIGWKRDEEGVRIYANAHDATNNTRYYRWDYDETWEIRAYYYSLYMYIKNNNTVRERTPAELVYNGWKYNSSKSIILGSSARLQSDIIFEAPVNFIEKDAERLAVRYSILLRQYALDKEGYDFYELMKRNTESLGTIFDVQPSEIRGNIKCLTDPSELVIGYVSASTITEKRVFISVGQLPGWRFQEYCPSFDVANHPDSLRLAYSGEYLSPIDAIYSLVVPGLIVGYLSSYPPCVDVTKRGASVVRPSYW
ncbi:MAG TPA: DUF4249 domain-containing protein [Chitinophagaceae bacterium]